MAINILKDTFKSSKEEASFYFREASATKEGGHHVSWDTTIAFYRDIYKYCSENINYPEKFYLEEWNMYSFPENESEDF